MQHRRHAERQGEKHQLAHPEDHLFPAARNRHVGGAAPALGCQVPELAAQLPLQGKHRVQQPHVDPLEPVKRSPLLVGRHPPEHAQADVVVLASDVGMRVMGDVVLEVPEVGRASQQIEGQRHHPVDPGVPGIRPVVAVVLDVEAHAGHGQAQRHRAHHHLPARAGREQQEQVRASQPGQHDRRLQVHGGHVALALAGGGEIRLDLTLQLARESGARLIGGDLAIGPQSRKRHTAP